MRVLVIGAGRGRGIASAVQRSGRLQLAGLVDVDGERRKAARELLGLTAGQVFADMDHAAETASPDFVVVATPTRLHREHTIGMLEAGRHVLCEKPLANTRADALAMRDAARTAGRQLAVIQNMRYAPHFRKCGELIAEGAVGKLAHVEIHFRRWRPPRGLVHAVLLNHGVHHLDTVRSITNGEARDIRAVEWDPVWCEGAGGGRFLRFTAVMKGGWVVSYDASYAEAGCETPHTAEFRIAGSRGTLVARGEVEAPLLHLHRVERAAGEFRAEQIPVPAGDWREMDREILEGFARSVRTGSPAETDVEDNLKTLDWLFRAVARLEGKA
jgi:predicted dehydrogenase